MTERDITSYEDAVELPDDAARTSAKEWLRRQGGTLGRLGDLATWLAGVQASWPPRPIERSRLVVFAADHGIAAADVSAQSVGATADRAPAIASGDDPTARLAVEFNVSVDVVDVGVDADLNHPVLTKYKVRRGSGRIDREDALTDAETVAAFQAGAEIADHAVDSGTDLLLVASIGVGATTPAAALVGVLTASDSAAMTGRGSGGPAIDDRAWMRKCAAIRDAMRRARPVRGDRQRLLAVVGGADLAAMTGVLLQASVRRTPVVLDDLSPCAAGLVAQRIAYRSPEWWLAGQSTADPAHQRALERLSLTGATGFGANVGGGIGALLALPGLRAAVALPAGAEATEAGGGGGHGSGS